MSETRKEFRLFWAWNLEREAAWLAEMSAAGWHLVSYSLGVYRFQEGEPEERAYEIDFMIVRGDEGREYFQLYKDSGWKHAASFANWHYFHAPLNQATRRPAYSDQGSRRAKLLRVLAVLGLAMLPTGMFGLVNPMLNGYFREAPIYYWIGGFSILIMLVFLFSMIRIAGKIRRLGRS